jgi:hypothetical protein
MCCCAAPAVCRCDMCPSSKAYQVTQYALFTGSAWMKTAGASFCGVQAPAAVHTAIRCSQGDLDAHLAVQKRLIGTIEC